MRELHKQAAALGHDAVAASLALEDVCALCRIVAAAGFLPEERLLEAAAARLTAAGGAGGGGAAGNGDAAAALALAACEAGLERTLGARLIDDIAAAGSPSDHLSGTAAVQLALAAAAAGKADSPLLQALVARCSAREMDLQPSSLRDLRLAMLLAGPGLMEALEGRSAVFLKVFCDASHPLDDPRHLPPRGPPAAGGLPPDTDILTPLEQELSDALHACEVPHTRAISLEGVFFPLGFEAHEASTAVCFEEPAALAVYDNRPSQRTAFQRWRYRVAAAAGWRVLAVSWKEWQAASDEGGAEACAAHVRKLLQGPTLDFEAAAE